MKLISKVGMGGRGR